jgi:hypothetical protein
MKIRSGAIQVFEAITKPAASCVRHGAPIRERAATAEGIQKPAGQESSRAQISIPKESQRRPRTLKAFVTAFAVSISAFTPLANAETTLPAKVTFSEHIAPIVFSNCVECHRKGEAGPFTLTNYRDVSKRARLIQKVTENRFMPPWHLEPGYGEFRHTRRLTDRDIALLGKWAENGAPEGDSKKTPPLPTFPEGWRLGKPDLVVQMTEPFTVPADGPDIYRNFVIPLDLDEDKWVTAIEIRPSSRPVVHHVLYHADTQGVARTLDGQDGRPGFNGMRFNKVDLGGWAVGAFPEKLPYGLARRLPKGADLILAGHFHPAGKEMEEQMTAAIYFAKEKPKRQLHEVLVPRGYGDRSALREGIPPGEKNFKITDVYRLPIKADLIAAWGHAHYIGKTMTGTATLPDGTVKKLFKINDWNFNWQGQYYYKEAISLPAGTVIKSEITYDNSADNPRNPHSPPRLIKWGLQSTDEMGALIFGFAVDDRDVKGPNHNKKRERESAVK